jgi:hypothetical protein
MQFIKDLLRNILILFVIGLALLYIFPDIMNQVIGILGGLFGPMVLLFLIISALPRKHGRSR